MQGDKPDTACMREFLQRHMREISDALMCGYVRIEFADEPCNMVHASVAWTADGGDTVKSSF